MLKRRARVRLALRLSQRLSSPTQWLRRRPNRVQVQRLASCPAVQAAEMEELLRVARLSFVALQDAWDRADVPALAALATAPLLADLQSQLAARGPQANRTEVLQLEARLLAWEELHEAFVASVEFSGLIRERLDAAAAPFRELWLLARVKSAGRHWQLARVQSLS